MIRAWSTPSRWRPPNDLPFGRRGCTRFTTSAAFAIAHARRREDSGLAIRARKLLELPEFEEGRDHELVALVMQIAHPHVSSPAVLAFEGP